MSTHTDKGTAASEQDGNDVAAAGHRRRRLLFLLPHVPGPEAPTGGARSTFHLIAGLSKTHDIAVLCLRSPLEPPMDAALHQVCDVVREVARDLEGRDRTWKYRVRRRLLPLFSRPTWVLSTEIPSYRQHLRSLTKSWRPDIVHIGYHVMAQYTPELETCPAPRVMTQYEPGVTASRDATRGTHGLDRVLGRLHAAAWARYERHAMRQVDAVVVFTESDRQALAPLARGVVIERIPLGVAVPSRSLNPCGGVPPTVLFIGNFTHPPNVDAALWLMRSIFPIVSRARPDSRLIVVGPNPPDEILTLAGPTMTVTGAVTSVVPFLDEASVVVAPLRRGGGMRVKVMEALAAGKAVVASPLAAAGLEVSHGEQLLLAERDHEFAALIVDLLNDPAARVRLAQSARSWAASNLDWSRSVAAYEALHDRLLAATSEGT